jgi:hypothetical protein
MSEVDDLLTREFKALPRKPANTASQAEKKRYSELMSAAAARALGEALRMKGLKGTLPNSCEDSRKRHTILQKTAREDLSDAEEVSTETDSDEE